MSFAYKSQIMKMVDVTVTRHGAVTYVNGYASEAASTVLTLEVSMQPTPGRELLLMPEGDRLRDWQDVWSYTALQEKDIITRDSIKYEVQKDSIWLGDGLRTQYYQTKAVRLDNQSE